MALFLLWSVLILLAIVEIRKAHILDKHLIIKDSVRKIYKLLEEDERNRFGEDSRILIHEDVEKEIIELLAKLDRL